MAWFQRKQKGILTDRSGQNEVPEGQWTKCPDCSEIVNQRALIENVGVCPKCGYHHRMDSLGYFELLFDEGSFELYDQGLCSKDPLEFYDRKPYAQRLEEAHEKTGMNGAARAAVGTIGGYRTSVAALDFSFIGGSMGSVVGEVVSRAIKRAYSEDIPLIIISQTGGARMMEGALSLMQMAKTSAHLTRLAERRVPFISLLTHPTTGGVTASFAMLGDFHLAEPGALIGFAGPRVIRQTIGQALPPGFQSAEFVQDKGFVDMIVDRRALRKRIIHLLDLVME
ncbi:MAG: acetyl-CoA carboxylase, carboxyltransferase subunit beta [Rhodothermales bacterium]